MDYQDRYLNYRTQIDAKLFSIINKNLPKSLYEPLEYILSAGGKRIRPMLVILACEACGGNPEKAFDAAVAMEVLHNFTLVHDDIMDNADTRRGKTTLHKKWNTNTAILTGDEMIGLAYRSLLNTPSERIREIALVFTEGVVEVCEGQGFDKEFEERKDVKLDEYLMMIGKKTSMLLETCAVIGAVIADAGDEEILTLRKYAKNLGLAFQIQDDLLDITAEESELGKKIGGDVVEGKKTFLLLKALESVKNKESLQKIKQVIKNNGIKDNTEEAILEIKKIYEEAGVINFARLEVESYTAKADDELEKLPDTEGKQMLKWLSAMLLSRNY